MLDAIINDFQTESSNYSFQETLVAAELVELAQNRSGVFDMITNKVPVSVELAA
jgi:hypothetical protein